MELRDNPAKCNIDTLLKFLFTGKKKTFLRFGGNPSIDWMLDDLKEFFSYIL